MRTESRPPPAPPTAAPLPPPPPPHGQCCVPARAAEGAAQGGSPRHRSAVACTTPPLPAAAYTTIPALIKPTTIPSWCAKRFARTRDSHVSGGFASPSSALPSTTGTSAVSAATAAARASGAAGCAEEPSSKRSMAHVSTEPQSMSKFQAMIRGILKSALLGMRQRTTASRATRVLISPAVPAKGQGQRQQSMRTGPTKSMKSFQRTSVVAKFRQRTSGNSGKRNTVMAALPPWIAGDHMGLRSRGATTCRGSSSSAVRSNACSHAPLKSRAAQIARHSAESKAPQSKKAWTSLGAAKGPKPVTHWATMHASPAQATPIQDSTRLSRLWYRSEPTMTVPVTTRTPQKKPTPATQRQRSRTISIVGSSGSCVIERPASGSRTMSMATGT
mmetsp:Transcript_50801/g.145813  ORF Transcript_50801/g.145813 Transcript_50801/m.145813 type:complete len:388 (+) Transcript_50801:492-1655(+)